MQFICSINYVDVIGLLAETEVTEEQTEDETERVSCRWTDALRAQRRPQ